MNLPFAILCIIIFFLLLEIIRVSKKRKDLILDNKILELIKKLIFPIIEDTNNKTNQILYKDFKYNFLKN